MTFTIDYLQRYNGIMRLFTMKREKQKSESKKKTRWSKSEPEQIERFTWHRQNSLGFYIPSPDIWIENSF